MVPSTSFTAPSTWKSNLQQYQVDMIIYFSTGCKTARNVETSPSYRPALPTTKEKGASKVLESSMNRWRILTLEMITDHPHAVGLGLKVVVRHLARTVYFD